MTQLEGLTRRLQPLLLLSPLQRCALAVCAVAATTLAQQLTLRSEPSIAPFVLYFLGIAVVSTLTGALPGLLAVLASAAAANYFFIEPRGSWAIEPHAVPATALFLASGGAVSVLCAFLRNTWLRLSRVQRDLEHAQRVAHVGSWRLDVATNRLLWSDETHRIFGVAPRTPLSYETFLQAVHPEDRARVDAAWQAALAGAPYDIEHRIVANGEVKWIHQRAELERDRHGVLCGGFGTTQDVTERRRAEDELRASEERFRTMFESAGAAIAQLDLETGRLERVNQRFTELIGRSRQELEGTDYLELVRPDERAAARAAIEEGRAGGLESGYHSERTLVRRDGESFEAEVFGTVVHDLGGRPVSAMLVVIDVSERSAAARELAAARLSAERARSTAEQASRAKDQFLAVLSHELRTPLSPVLTSLSLLEREPLSEQGRHYLQVVRRNVELEAHLIDDLLDLTRIARGQIDLQPRRVDLCTVLERAIEVCRPDIDARRQHFEVDYGPRPYVVEADPARLQQVFWNLLKNAVKFTPKDGCIGLRCRPAEDGEMTVEVSDSGVGIDAAVLPGIFHAFARGERRGDHRFGGLGLGLAISRSLVELHGGRIDARSDGPGKGATFLVTLPLISFGDGSAREPASVAARRTAAAPRALRVLLVEDHGDTAETMVAMLSLVGHEVLTAADVATALGRLDSEPFDLLISDLGLPDRSGLDLVKELRARGSRLPAIALSGYGLENDVRQSRDAGFAAHLVKPVDPNRLFDTMERVSRAAQGDAGSDMRTV